MDVSPAGPRAVELPSSGELSLAGTLCASHFVSFYPKLARDARTQEGGLDA
jgi:hypothetical protein